MTSFIRAAGGVLVHPKRKNRFLVVHRPRYDDWSLPKGKLARGETARACALREVYEETGLVCDLLEELTPVTFPTRNANLKTVQYWLMKPVSGEFTVNGEVDAVTWVNREQALALLSYEVDHTVLVEAHRRVKELRRADKAVRKLAEAIDAPTA